MKELGGFFELEITKRNYSYHEQAVAFSSGRACLNFIISQIQPRKIWLPFYACNSLLQPIVINNISYEFYSINEELELIENVTLQEKEYLIYINYFGLKSKFIKRLITSYGEKLIIDNTQAFFEKECKTNWHFNSARKYFGVPDGGYLYTPYTVDVTCERNLDIGYSHLVNRLLGRQQQAYQEFVINEQAFTSDIKKISVLSEYLLSNVDYEYVAKKRRKNFKLYYEMFCDINRLKLELSSELIPLCYPLLLEEETNRELLYRENIFIPTFWKDTLERGIPGFEVEKEFTKKLLPLPVDHRYDASDLNFLIHKIKKIAYI